VRDEKIKNSGFNSPTSTSSSSILSARLIEPEFWKCAKLGVERIDGGLERTLRQVSTGISLPPPEGRDNGPWNWAYISYLNAKFCYTLTLS